MGQLIFFNMMTLDGFFESENKELDWHTVDDEFNKFSIDQLNSADNLIFGRKTYEMMADYWPTKKAKSDDPIIAKKMNSIEKIVFSKMLDNTNWENTILYRELI